MVSKTQAEAPIRSLDQRMEALKRANDIRVRRARLKKDLKDGHVQIEQILSNPPEYVSTAKVFDMLMAVPKFGRVKAARFLRVQGVGAAAGVKAGVPQRFAGVDIADAGNTRLIQQKVFQGTL